MTQPFDAISLAYESAGPPPRPTSVTVLSILGIIWASLLLLAGLMLAVAYAPVFRNSVGLPTRIQRPVSIYLSIQSLALLILATALMTFSIRALSLRESARRHAIAWSLILICWYCASSVAATLTTHSATPHVRTVSRHSIQESYLVVDHRPAAILLNWIVRFIVKCWPAVMFLVFWRRPHVIAAFQGNNASKPATD